MKKKNAGFSLVELVIAIATIAVISGISAYAISNVPRYRARECAKIIASNLGEVKVMTLGKAKKNGDIVWELYRKNSTFYVRCLTNAAASSTPDISGERRISKGALHIYLADESGNETELNDGEALKLAFNRATGALYGCETHGSTAIGDQKSHEGSNYTYDASSYTPVKKIIVRGASWEYIVDIAPATGKISN